MKATKASGGGRLARERKSLELMVQFYCEERHEGTRLCPECQQLLERTKVHLSACRHGTEKPICAYCSYKCYEPECRERILTVISLERKRLLFRHPRLAVRYWMDGFHAPPAMPPRREYASWGGE